MADPIIKIKRSAVPGKIPNTTTLPVGEFAINTYDGKVFIQQDQGGVGVGSTVIVVNPWSVGTGTNTYNTYFTVGNVGIGTTNPTENLSVLGKIQIQQNSGSNNRLIFRGQPGSSYRWNIDNYSSANEFRIFREDDATSANGSVAVSISTTGTLTATKFSGDGSLLTGITAAGTGIVVQNQGSAVGTANTLNFSTNLTASFASGTATISLSNNPSISGILTADQVYTSNNGNGTNIRIGDDLWIGDVNIANTTRFSGAQDSTKAFIIFGSSDSVALGRTGTGPLYYGGNFAVSGIVTASSFVKSGGTSSQFLKADGSVDSSIYLTSYTETDTLNSVTGRGNSTSNGISVGVLTATSGNFSGIITSSGANISGVTTSGGFNATTGNTYQINGTSVLSSNTLGSGVVNSSLTSVGTLTNLNVGNINSTGVVTASSFVGNLTGTATSTTNIPNLTGDVTSVNTTTTLATVNNNVGTFGSSTSIPSITVNAKGLVTGVTTSAITVGDGTLTLNVAGVGLTGSQTFSANQGSNATFTVTSNATSDNTNGAIVSRNSAGGFSAGIITATSFSGSLSGTATNANFINITTNSTDNNVYYIPFESGIGYTSLYIDSGLTYNPGQDLLSLNNLSATNITVNQGINATGVITASSFVGTLIGVASSATQLQNARTISLSGDVVGSVSFDGTQNVSIAATIQPNSVALGSDTTGDYVQSISGTSNQITVTSGTGEGSTPTLSIPSQFTAPQDVTVTRDLQVNRNLNVNGNITIGGTSATLFTTEFKVYDPDIVLGFRTDGSGNDVSNDNTANHGGIAIASTEGTPLISLYDVGVGETNPATYKKFMWFKSGTFSGLGTDAWLSNYAIGIGSTQVPNGVRLAAGSVQFTERDLSVVRNINASGVVTASSFSGTLSGNASSATYATSAGVSTSVIGGIGSITQLRVTGVSTFSNGPVLIGSGTSTGTASQILQVTGGAYVSGDVGIGTANPQTALYLDGVLGFRNSNIRIGNNQTSPSATGSANICIGDFAGNPISSGIRNVMIGDYANAFGQNGDYNVMLGYKGYTNGSHNIHIGEYHSGGSGNYNIVIGNGDAANNYNFGAPNPSKNVQFAVGVNTTGNAPSNSQYWLVGDENFNIGIGTNTPTSKLHVVGNTLISGIVTATSFVKSGGTSSQFLKADGSVDTNTYLTSFSETDTLNSVTGRGNTTSNGISIGVLTATSGNFSGIVTSSGANISGVTTSNGFNATTGNTYQINGTTVLSSNTLGSGVVNSSLTSVGTLGQLNVTGVTTSSIFVSNVATGTAPLTVASTTKVANLNADLLDDQDGAYYLNYNNLTNTPTIGNGTLTLAVSGTGLSGSQTFTANQTGNATFTVTSNATSDNTNSTIVARDASGGFSAGIITATSFSGPLTGTASSTTNIPNLTGDVTSVNTVTTLATVNSNVGTYGDTGAIPVVTVNAKGLVTGVSTVAPNDGTLTLNVSGTGLSGSASFSANQSGAATFTVTSNATSNNTPSTIVARDASGGFSAGIITATLSGTATTATNLADAANITTGTINSARLSGTYNIDISGSAGYATTAGIATVAQGLTGTPNITVGIVTASSFVKSGGTSSQFLKADGSVDSSTYLTSYTETDTLDAVTTRGNVTTNGISVGILTATSGNFSGIVTSTGANIAGVSTFVQISAGGTTGTSGQVLQSTGTGLAWATPSSGGGSSNLTGISTLGFFGDDQNITSNLDLPANTLLYTVHKNINVATGSTMTVGSGTTIVMDRFNNLDDVVATSFKGDGSQLTGIPVGDLYELDQISPAGRENTYTPTFNYETVAVTNPFRLLISIDGILQSAYIHNTEYVFNNSLLTSRTGYTIDYDGNIKFTEALPEGSEVMIKTTAGTTKSTTRRYPFNALDILY